VTRPPTEDIGSLGEFGLIAKIKGLLPQGPDIVLGPGDDAAIIKASDGLVVATTDMAVEDIHFRRDWSSARQIGAKVAAANLADLVCKGARPTALLVALGVPANLPAEWALELAMGLRDEAAKVGASIVGGDMSRSEKIVISIAALGSLDGRAAVLRSGAKVGDLIVLAATTGLSAAGLTLLKSSNIPDADRFEELLSAHRTPRLVYQLALDLATSGAHSMCDVSDGLIADLGHICQASGVKGRIDPARLDLSTLQDAAAMLSVDPLRWALAGGEDHAFVATVDPETPLPGGVRVIGEVVSGSGVEVVGIDVSHWLGGHDHFDLRHSRSSTS